MATYTLTSKAKPRITEKGSDDSQAERLYQAMQELGGGPVTLEQIVKRCEYRKYDALLKAEPSVEKSVIYHLKKWEKAGIVNRS